MKHVRLGNNGLDVGRIGLGCMGMSAHSPLAWFLAQGDDLAPIRGPKRVNYLQQNVAAESPELSPEQLATLDAAAARIGDRYSNPRIGGWWKVSPKVRCDAPTRSR